MSYLQAHHQKLRKRKKEETKNLKSKFFIKKFILINLEMNCKYKNLFGEPGKGIHSYRVFGFAAVDVGLTILLIMVIVFIISKLMKSRGKKLTKNNYIAITVSTTILVAITTVFIHKLFCVDTYGNNLLGIS